MTPPLKVVAIDGDGYVVRGTMDVEEARAAVVEHRRGTRLQPGEEYEDVPPANRVGWFRWNPCNRHACWTADGHSSGHLDYVDGAGRGRWIGVYFAYAV